MVYIDLEDGSYFWYRDDGAPCSPPFETFEEAIKYRTYIYRCPKYFDINSGTVSLENVPPALWDYEKKRSQNAPEPEFWPYLSEPEPNEETKVEEVKNVQ